MKKVLIISQNALSLHANNGKTMTGLFDAWSPEELFQIYFQDEIPESDKFQYFYRLRDIDILGLLAKKNINANFEILPSEYVREHRPNISKYKLLLTNILKNLNKTKHLTRDILYSFYDLYEQDMYMWIRKYNPELIFLVASDQEFIYKIALRMKSKFNLPLYTFFMDDFYINKKQGLFNSGYLKLVERTVMESKSCFCISDKMSDEYKKIFHKSFGVLIHPIKISNDTLCSSNCDKLYYENKINEKNIINIVYAGGLTLGRFETLIKFAKLINFLNDIRNFRIALNVCSGSELTTSQLISIESLNINYLGKLNKFELNELYKLSNFVLHLESDKLKNINKTHLSISTKIPECLANGKCLIGFGPKQIASMEIIYKNRIGYFIDSQMPLKNNVEKLWHIINSNEDQKIVCKNGINFLLENFTSEIMTHRLISAFEDIPGEI